MKTIDTLEVMGETYFLNIEKKGESCVDYYVCLQEPDGNYGILDRFSNVGKETALRMFKDYVEAIVTDSIPASLDEVLSN